MGRSHRTIGLCAAGMLAFGAAWADEPAYPGPTSVFARPAAASVGRPRDPLSLLLRRADGRPAFSVVEMPGQGAQFGPPQRPHHALSFASDAPKRWLRSVGVVATDCSTRVRFPGRFKQTSEGVQADLAAQVVFACLY